MITDYHLSARAADAHPYCTVHLEPGVGTLGLSECCSNDHTQREDRNKHHGHEYAMRLQCSTSQFGLKPHVKAAGQPASRCMNFWNDRTWTYTDIHVDLCTHGIHGLSKLTMMNLADGTMSTDGIV